MKVLKKIQIDSKPPLVKNLLFVEGFGRGGKLVLGNVINGFDGVEPIQYYGLLEQLPFLEKFKLIDKKITQEIIRCEVDTHCYEMLIGRNFNHRKYDGTAIAKVPNYKKYLERSGEEDRDKNLKSFLKDNAYSFFMMHELMPNIKIYFETFPDLKVLSIKRNPVDIVYSWHKRDLGKRFGQDSKIFIVPIKGKGGPIPWYAHSFREQYYSLSDLDRIILCVQKLFAMYKNSYAKLPQKLKDRILFVTFEDLIFRHPDQIIAKMGKFLQKKPLPEMASILKREDIPRKAAHGQQCPRLEEKFMCTECKAVELKKIASKKYFDGLIKLQKNYETGKTY